MCVCDVMEMTQEQTTRHVPTTPVFSVYSLDLLELRSLPYTAVSYMNLDFE